MKEPGCPAIHPKLSFKRATFDASNDRLAAYPPLVSQGAGGGVSLV
jgi:hypothetical protein